MATDDWHDGKLEGLAAPSVLAGAARDRHWVAVAVVEHGAKDGRRVLGIACGQFMEALTKRRGVSANPVRAVFFADAFQERVDGPFLFPDDIPFRRELDATGQVMHTVDRPTPDWNGVTGHINAALIDQARQGLESPIFYLCGPPGMVLAITKTLTEMGIKDLCVHPQGTRWSPRGTHRR